MNEREKYELVLIKRKMKEIDGEKVNSYRTEYLISF